MKIPALVVMLVLAAGPVLAAPLPHQIARMDGSQIHFTLDHPEAEPKGVLLIAQGSSCLPASVSPSLRAVRAGFPEHIALIVEKIGIAPDAPIVDGHIDCPQAYVENYTFSQRLEDYLLVLDHLRSRNDLPMENLVLFGGSEGGLVISRLAAVIEADAAIILSSATASTFGDMVRSTVPPEGHATIDAGFAAAKARPGSTEIFAGHTHRFWADILDYRALPDLLQAKMPLLLIQGGLDPSAPVAEARATSDAFAEAGLCNLTYWEFPALDHGMNAPDGTSRLTDTAKLAAAWVGQPSPPCP